MRKIWIILLSIASIYEVYATQIEIAFWHSMAGNLGRVLEQIVTDFNSHNQQYKIVPMYKGNYHEALTSTVAAFRAGRGPDIVQIFDIATATMINPPGVIKPMHQILKDSGRHLNLEQFLKPAIDYYSNEQGELLAAPFNISTPALFYNKSLLDKAGFTSDSNLKTWDDVGKVSTVLINKGLVSCGFSSAWIGWSLFESFSLIHNLPYATKNNGFDSLDVKVAFNNNETARFIQRLHDWQNKGIFLYGGRLDDAQSFFTSGKCAMLIQSSGSFADLAPAVKFELGMTRVPYLEDYHENDLGNLIGGAAVWAMANLPSEKYAAIADFVIYLCSPKVQSFWQKKTGYISVVRHKYLPNIAVEHQNKYDENMKNTQDFVISREKKYKGIRLGNYMQIRDLVERQLEAVFAGYSNVIDSLEIAEMESNMMLKRFKRNVNI